MYYKRPDKSLWFVNSVSNCK